MTYELELELLLRVTIAALCGGIIGYERFNANKEAGIKTHLIVCLASAMFMVVSQYGFLDVVLRFGVLKVDVARVAAQVVTGIGFLGAGMIFIHNGLVNGLTTAAGIWATSAVGLSIGSGLYILGVGGTLLLYCTHRIFQLKILSSLRSTKTRIVIEAEDIPDLMDRVRDVFYSLNIPIAHYQYERLSADNNKAMLTLQLNWRPDDKLTSLLDHLGRESYIVSVGI